jgi:hypothetical protein
MDARAAVDRLRVLKDFEEYEDAQLIRLKLRALADAFDKRQIKERQRKPARGRRRVTITVSNRKRKDTKR